MRLFLAKSQRPPNRRSAWWWMQSDRTGLSGQFPANREKNREFCNSGASEANFVARNHCAAATFYEIPYAN